MAHGSVGLAFMLRLPRQLAAGQQTVVELTFNALATAPVGTAALTFGDQQITREMVDAQAVDLPVSFIGGSVSINK